MASKIRDVTVTLGGENESNKYYSFGGLKCSECGKPILSIAFGNIHDKKKRTYEDGCNDSIDLLCANCGRVYPICRINKHHSGDEDIIAMYLCENDGIFRNVELAQRMREKLKSLLGINPD